MRIMRGWFGLILIMVVLGLGSCSEQTSSQLPLSSQTSVKTVQPNLSKVVMGQTVYVPIYSYIYHHNSQNRIINLSATLSIRNTDLKNSIIVTSVRYYDTEGQLIRQDLEQPIELKALASTSFFVASDDSQGGAGANYIVEWVAETQVSEPVIEAVMISTSSSQGISFVSPGRVQKQYQGKVMGQ